jgi:hypothetical protein
MEPLQNSYKVSGVTVVSANNNVTVPVEVSGRFDEKSKKA